VRADWKSTCAHNLFSSIIIISTEVFNTRESLKAESIAFKIRLTKVGWDLDINGVPEKYSPERNKTEKKSITIEKSHCLEIRRRIAIVLAEFAIRVKIDWERERITEVNEKYYFLVYS
jgi:hypothetical protein